MNFETELIKQNNEIAKQNYAEHGQKKDKSEILSSISY